VSAAERLAEALADIQMFTQRPKRDALMLAQSLVAVDPSLAADIEDGAALRRLSGANGTWTISNVRTAGRGVGYAAEAWTYGTGRLVKVLGHDDQDMMPPTFATIAEAADACREAIEAQR
jgi:hypothetical protein